VSRRRDLDEDDVRIRPGRGKSRPRSKERPSHTDALPGFVVAVDRGRFTAVLGTPDEPGVEVYAVKARELGRKGIDRVRVGRDRRHPHGAPAPAGSAVELDGRQHDREHREGERAEPDQNRSVDPAHCPNIRTS